MLKITLVIFIFGNILIIQDTFSFNPRTTGSAHKQYEVFIKKVIEMCGLTIPNKVIPMNTTLSAECDRKKKKECINQIACGRELVTPNKIDLKCNSLLSHSEMINFFILKHNKRGKKHERCLKKQFERLSLEERVHLFNKLFNSSCTKLQKLGNLLFPLMYKRLLEPHDLPSGFEKKDWYSKEEIIRGVIKEIETKMQNTTNNAQTELLNEIKNRYENYQKMIYEGKEVKLPGYFHCTKNTSDFIPLIETQLNVSKEAVHGNGAYVATEPAIGQYGISGGFGYICVGLALADVQLPPLSLTEKEADMAKKQYGPTAAVSLTNSAREGSGSTDNNFKFRPDGSSKEKSSFRAFGKSLKITPKSYVIYDSNNLEAKETAEKAKGIRSDLVFVPKDEFLEEQKLLDSFGRYEPAHHAVGWNAALERQREIDNIFPKVRENKNGPNNENDDEWDVEDY